MEMELVNNEDHSYSCNECVGTNCDNPRKKEVDELYRFYIGGNRAGNRADRIGFVMCEDCLKKLYNMIEFHDGSNFIPQNKFQNMDKTEVKVVWFDFVKRPLKIKQKNMVIDMQKWQFEEYGKSWLAYEIE